MQNVKSVQNPSVAIIIKYLESDLPKYIIQFSKSLNVANLDNKIFPLKPDFT